MPTFTRQGDLHWHLWLVDDSPDFAFFPGGIVAGLDEPTPIRLKVGNAAYGEIHIWKRHGHWVKRTGMDVPALVHEKLGHSGPVYNTESGSKLKVSLRLSPSALLVLELIERGTMHFSVTSLYAHPAHLDGQIIGRYSGRR
jgi:hypothetical protein